MSVTLIIIIATVAISMQGWRDSTLQSKALFSAYRIAHHNEHWRIVSNVFIHSGYLHLGLNMYALYIFGDHAEFLFNMHKPGMGWIYLLLVYFGGGVFSSVPSMIKHKDNPAYNALGASGAVFAVVFARIFMSPTSSIPLIIGVSVPAIVLGILYFAYELYMDKKSNGRIAHDAHYMGAISGVLLTIILVPNAVSVFIERVSNWLF